LGCLRLLGRLQPGKYRATTRRRSHDCAPGCGPGGFGTGHAIGFVHTTFATVFARGFYAAAGPCGVDTDACVADRGEFRRR
jgi:hypothetical protein